MYKASTNLAVAVAAAAGFTTLAGGQAQAQEQCSFYTVVRGDVLSRIATAAEVPGGFRVLFDANTTVLESPNRLEVGQVLAIPCADGSLPTGAAAVVAASTAPAPVTSAPARPLRIATGSDYAPFTDEDLPGGGMITRMVDRSMQLGNPDQEYDIVFVNDWGSHLETLLPIGAIDMAFPWFRPDCSRVENLGPASASRCTDFNHSDPFYEIIVDFYTLNGSEYANAQSTDDLFGARVCRPEAWFTFDLEAAQLVEPNITYVTTVAQNGCFQLLQNGEVDVVTYDALPAEEDIRSAGMVDAVATLEPLRGAVSSHIFVSKDNAFANEALPIINAGLEQLRLSGEWFNIVRESIQQTVEN
ncbi:peptidoglycan-binding protein LysM [Loktanella sp. 5RATIMAR09]|uniref:LysM peptidoglycan-binding domain-containing protein n=1 Tax=Loktanella sp. 5RATIMAR09 TaxID=1225655 RepID=UPI0006EBE0D2|nr:transporter substrate-binding domain-containing protein [Loktanella sp. 5RATIMAR09]KQI72679.1 peptidoglycan-binding protein LysM [Loktanella sp. 5RATIMAR09]